MLDPSSPRSSTVLVVDDDPGDQELMRRGIGQGGLGIDMRAVADGRQALDYLMRRGAFEEPASAPRPDLILLDLNMPRVDGKLVLAKLRDVPELRRIPIVVMTTSSNDLDVTECYELGANAYVTKPITIDEFDRMLRAIESYWLRAITPPPQTTS